MDYIAYKIPQGEGHPQISGIEQLRYAENYYFATVPDLSTVASGLIQKYSIVTTNAQVVEGLQYFISTKDSAKLYKNYSSGQAYEFFDEDFNEQLGIRIKRPLVDQEVIDRYEAIRWVRTQMVRDYYKQKFSTLAANKTPQERATWDAQLAEAEGVLNGDSILTPVLDLLVTARNTDITTLAQQIVAAHQAYTLEVAQLFAEEETLVTQLKNAEGDDIINVRLPVQTTIIPGDTRFDAVSPGS